VLAQERGTARTTVLIVLGVVLLFSLPFVISVAVVGWVLATAPAPATITSLDVEMKVRHDGVVEVEEPRRSTTAPTLSSASTEVCVPGTSPTAAWSSSGGCALSRPSSASRTGDSAQVRDGVGGLTARGRSTSSPVEALTTLDPGSVTDPRPELVP
jgi:hypothetical protein